MFLCMCPEGSEGATFAMLTTLSNLAGACGYSVAAGFTAIWDVSNDSLEAGNWEGMWRLTLLIGCVQLFGLLFIWMLPKSMEDQLIAQKSDITSVRNYVCISHPL